MTAACPLPKAGRKEQSGDAIREANKERRIDFFLTFMLLNLDIFCFGIFCFFIMEVMSDEEPNKPVSNGNKGSLILRLKAEIPKKPASRKMSIAQSFFCFSK